MIKLSAFFSLSLFLFIKIWSWFDSYGFTRGRSQMNELTGFHGYRLKIRHLVLWKLSSVLFINCVFDSRNCDQENKSIRCFFVYIYKIRSFHSCSFVFFIEVITYFRWYNSWFHCFCQISNLSLYVLVFGVYVK